MIGWLVAAVFAVLSVYLAFRRLRPPESVPVGSADTGSGKEPGARQDASEKALQGMSRYLKAAVLDPLEQGLQAGDLRSPVEDAVDALRDLSFYARVVPEGVTGGEDLILQIQAVAREYTLATGASVKVSGPEGPVKAVLDAERFKDALFLLLENAGRFGKGQAVDVTVRQEGDRVSIRIRDRGPGFSEKALLQAFEPFWTTESDALGLGLPQAQKLLEGQGASLTVGNPAGGGGEAVVILTRKW